MEFWLQILVTILTSVLASSGLWAFLGARIDRSTAERDMIIGLGHDRILFLGMKYIQRGWITQVEYEDLVTFLYEPYKNLGGNGSVTRIMTEVEKLPIKSQDFGGTK